MDVQSHQIGFSSGATCTLVRNEQKPSHSLMSTRRFGLHTLVARSEHKRIKMAQTAAKAIAVESTAPIVPYLSGGGRGEG